MNRLELLDKVRSCVPQLGWDSKFPDLYGKYGMTICGICDGWHWFEENNITEYSRQQGHLPITDATDIELLEMWAIADNYCLNEYKKWLKRSEDKSSKLDDFIGECERKYFGYDDDGYTDKTIDRVFDSIFKVLESSEYKNISDIEECKQKVEQLNNLGIEVTPTEFNVVRKILTRTARAIRDNTSEEHFKIQRSFAIDTLAGKRNRDVFL